jgi:hypothetical protein
VSLDLCHRMSDQLFFPCIYIYIYIYIYAQLFTSSLTALEDSEIYSFMLIKKQKVILLILLFEKNALDQLF